MHAAFGELACKTWVYSARRGAHHWHQAPSHFRLLARNNQRDGATSSGGVLTLSPLSTREPGLLVEKRDEMQLPAENRIERAGVKSDILQSPDWLKSKSSKQDRKSTRLNSSHR